MLASNSIIRGYCYRLHLSVRPFVCPLCSLLLSHWTKFNQIWCVSYSHEWGAQRKKKCGPVPWGGGQKVKYHLISITKSISKNCIPNFVCVLTNERYKTYQMGFLFCRLGHALGVGLGGFLGAKIKFRPAVSMLCFLLLNHWMKFNQIWYVSYSHKWGMQRNFFLALPPGALGRSQKVKYHLISITKSISKIFIPNFVCVLTNERYKTYQTSFLFCSLGHAPVVGLWGTGGAQVVKKRNFQTWSCGILNR